MNYENNFQNFDLEDTIKNYINDINKKYGFEDISENNPLYNDEDEDYVDLGFEDQEDFIDFDT